MIKRLICVVFGHSFEPISCLRKKTNGNLRYLDNKNMIISFCPDCNKIKIVLEKRIK